MFSGGIEKQHRAVMGLMTLVHNKFLFFTVKHVLAKLKY